MRWVLELVVVIVQGRLALVEIRRVEYDVGTFAAEFEGDLKRNQVKSKRCRDCFEELTFLRLLLAAASMILRPVIVLPVNATLSTSRWAAIAAPPTLPSDGLTRFEIKYTSVAGASYGVHGVQNAWRKAIRIPSVRGRRRLWKYGPGFFDEL